MQPAADSARAIDSTALATPRRLTRPAFNRPLLAWHRRRSRTLLLRNSNDPWAILVAEVMSQQTGIDRVMTRWSTFMKRWPTPAQLARAPNAHVLEAWSGLGYNRRALALRAAAEQIVVDHDGRVPRDVGALELLPGVGPYTARAVAASAFGTPVAPLDVNVRRVLSRVLGQETDLQAKADALVSRGQPRRWLDAVMDLGAIVCRPVPACGDCPVRSVCASAGQVRGASARGPGSGQAFNATTRWLRGRLLSLAVAASGGWTPVPSSLGDHQPGAVARAVEALRREGFIDVDGPRMRVRE